MKRPTSALAMTAVVVLLAGCQSVLGQSSLTSNSLPAADPSSVDLSGYFSARLEAGRDHLEKGRPTQAVVAFRQASYDARHAGAAYNGMGVAYARLGRTDLAHRYFAMAVAADPQDQRFERNLARLDTSLELHPTTDEQLAATEATAGETPGVSRETAQTLVPGSAAPSAASRSAGTGAALTRVSSREVRIASNAGREPAMSVSSAATETSRPARRQAERHVGQSYPVRVELAPPSPSQASYPVRIALAEVPVRRSAYPIRIELADVAASRSAHSTRVDASRAN